MAIKKINQDLVRHVGGHVMAMQLAGARDPVGMSDEHLDRLADLAVRAAMALDAAVPRVEERLSAEEEKAEKAEKAEEAAEKARHEPSPAHEAHRSADHAPAKRL